MLLLGIALVVAGIIFAALLIVTRRMRRRHVQWIGLSLVVASVAIAARFETDSSRDTYTPLDVPVRALAGDLGRWQFVPAVTGYHEVALVAQCQSAEPDTVLGITFMRPDSSARSEVDVSWELWEGTQRRAQGRTTGRGHGYNSRSPGRILFTGDLVAKHRYELRTRFNRGGAVLERSSPRIKVQRHPADYEWVAWSFLPTCVLVLTLGLSGALMLRRASRSPQTV